MVKWKECYTWTEMIRDPMSALFSSKLCKLGKVIDFSEFWFFKKSISRVIVKTKWGKLVYVLILSYEF